LLRLRAAGLSHILAKRMQAHLDFVSRKYRKDIAIRMPPFSAGYDVVYRVFDRLPEAFCAAGFCGRLA
jgi:hypothetical protein